MDLNKSGLNSLEWSFSKPQPSPVFYGIFLGVEAFVTKTCAVTPLPFPSVSPQQLLVPQGRHTQQHPHPWQELLPSTCTQETQFQEPVLP